MSRRAPSFVNLVFALFIIGVGLMLLVPQYFTRLPW